MSTIPVKITKEKISEMKQRLLNWKVELLANLKVELLANEYPPFMCLFIDILFSFTQTNINEIDKVLDFWKGKDYSMDMDINDISKNIMNEHAYSTLGYLYDMLMNFPYRTSNYEGYLDEGNPDQIWLQIFERVFQKSNFPLFLMDAFVEFKKSYLVHFQIEALKI